MRSKQHQLKKENKTLKQKIAYLEALLVDEGHVHQFLTVNTKEIEMGSLADFQRVEDMRHIETQICKTCHKTNINHGYGYAKKD